MFGLWMELVVVYVWFMDGTCSVGLVGGWNCKGGIIKPNRRIRFSVDAITEKEEIVWCMMIRTYIAFLECCSVGSNVLVYVYRGNYLYQHGRGGRKFHQKS